jgi:acetyl esterase
MNDIIDPEVLAAQALLRERGLPAADVLVQGVVAARETVRAQQAFLNEGGPEMDSVTDHAVPGTSPALTLRLYRPKGATGALPLYLHLHGGGFATGSIASLDRWKREIAAEAGVAVAGIDYALAPEHAYPVAIEQVLAALRWLQAEAAALGLDGARIGIGGDSAGGNLALNALLRLRDAGGPVPLLGVIVYGMLSADHDSPSHRDLGDGRFGLSTARLDWFWTQYLGGRTGREDPGAAPLGARLEGLPPLLLIAAGLDPLLDDTLNLQRRLQAAGVTHELRRFEGVPHGFIGQTALLSKARAARAEVVAAIRRRLGG